MPLSDADRAEIGDAERRLLDPAVRRDPATLEALLADDFVEIGASGRRYTKRDIIAALATENTGFQATLGDLELDEVAEGVAIVRYRTESRSHSGVRPRRALRTSLWRRTSEGWQLFHHQGTLIDTE